MPKFLNNIDLNQNELQGVVIEPLSTAPSNPKEGRVYYNTTDKHFYRYNGTSWVTYQNELTTVEASTLEIDSTPTNGSNHLVTSGGVYTAINDIDALPDQSGNSGKYLTTNGTTASWGTVSESDPTVPSWAKASSKPSYTASEVGAIPSADKGAASGVVPLNASSKIDPTYLPSYVDDVVEGYYDSITGKFYEESTFTTEITAEAGKIYNDLTTNRSYRWGGSSYVVMPIGSTVSITQNLSSGTKIGSITIDGTATDLYAPTNTDVNVTQTKGIYSSYTYWRPLTLGSSSNSTSTGAFSTTTDDEYTFDNLRFQPSTGTLRTRIYNVAPTAAGTTASNNQMASDSTNNIYFKVNNGTDTVMTLYSNGTDMQVRPGGQYDDQVDLGKSTVRWKDLYLSGTIYTTPASTTVASGDKILVSDTSAGTISSGITLGTSTTQYLANDGSWQNVPDEIMWINLQKTTSGDNVTYTTTETYSQINSAISAGKIPVLTYIEQYDMMELYYCMYGSNAGDPIKFNRIWYISNNSLAMDVYEIDDNNTWDYHYYTYDIPSSISDLDDVFIATIGTTTYAQVLAAYNAHKIIFATDSTCKLYVPLVKYSDWNDIFYFATVSYYNDGSDNYLPMIYRQGLSLDDGWLTPGQSYILDTTTLNNHYVIAGNRESATIGTKATVEGNDNTAQGIYSHVEGYKNDIYTNGESSHVEGRHNTIYASWSHAEGKDNQILDPNSSASSNHVEGLQNTLYDGQNNHVEGSANAIKGNTQSSHIEGRANILFNTLQSHVEGFGNIVTGNYSHVENYGEAEKAILLTGNANSTTYTVENVVIIPENIIVNQCYIFQPTYKASGIYVPIICPIVSWTLDSNDNSITQLTVSETLSSDTALSSAQFYILISRAHHDKAHVQGIDTISGDVGQHVAGKYNFVTTGAEIIGGGSSTTRLNIRTLDWSGNETLAGKLTVGTDPTNNMDVATKQYVDSQVFVATYNTTTYADILAAYKAGKTIVCKTTDSLKGTYYANLHIAQMVNNNYNQYVFIFSAPYSYYSYNSSSASISPYSKTRYYMIAYHTAWSSTLVDEQKQPSTATITINVSNWSTNATTGAITYTDSSLSGMTSSAYVQVSPDPSSINYAAEAGVYCSAQGSSSLTFTCNTIPTASITMNILWWRSA